MPRVRGPGARLRRAARLGLLAAIVTATSSARAEPPNEPQFAVAVRAHGRLEQQLRDAVTNVVAVDLGAPVQAEVTEDASGAAVVAGTGDHASWVTVVVESLRRETLRYRIRVHRADGSVFQRTGFVTSAGELTVRVPSDVLMGFLARTTNPAPRLALVVNGGPHKPDPLWKEIARSRGFRLLSAYEVDLARRAMREKRDDSAALRQYIGATALVQVDVIRGAGTGVLLRSTVYDDGPIRGQLMSASPREIAASVSLLLSHELLPTPYNRPAAEPAR